jgi:hypothetical protein
MVLKKETFFFAVIVLFCLAISLLAYSWRPTDPLTLTIRFLALNGYIAVAIAAIITPFIKEITLFFKKPFTKIHHYFASAGLLLVTLHPIAVFIRFMDPNVFLPEFENLYVFFFFGGIIALLLIYVGVGAVYLRRKFMTVWRPFHMLVYLAIFIGVIHANLRGIDFGNIYIQIIFDALFALALFALVLKRIQFYRIKQRAKRFKLAQANSGSK